VALSVSLSRKLLIHQRVSSRKLLGENPRSSGQSAASANSTTPGEELASPSLLKDIVSYGREVVDRWCTVGDAIRELWHTVRIPELVAGDGFIVTSRHNHRGWTYALGRLWSTIRNATLLSLRGSLFMATVCVCVTLVGLCFVETLPLLVWIAKRVVPEATRIYGPAISAHPWLVAVVFPANLLNFLVLMLFIARASRQFIVGDHVQTNLLAIIGGFCGITTLCNACLIWMISTIRAPASQIAVFHLQLQFTYTIMCLGCCAYCIKRVSKVAYGLSETCVAMAATWFLISRIILSRPGPTLITIREISLSDWMALGAAAYVFARGIGNVVEGFEER